MFQNLIPQAITITPHLKVVNNGDCYRMPRFPNSYADLEEMINMKFEHHRLPDNFCFKYEDSDKDSINLESQSDFEAFQEFVYQEHLETIKIRIDSKSYKQYFENMPLQQQQQQSNLTSPFIASTNSTLGVMLNPYQTSYQNLISRNTPIKQHNNEQQPFTSNSPYQNQTTPDASSSPLTQQLMILLAAHQQLQSQQQSQQQQQNQFQLVQQHQLQQQQQQQQQQSSQLPQSHPSHPSGGVRHPSVSSNSNIFHTNPANNTSHASQTQIPLLSKRASEVNTANENQISLQGGKRISSVNQSQLDNHQSSNAQNYTGGFFDHIETKASNKNQIFCLNQSVEEPCQNMSFRQNPRQNSNNQQQQQQQIQAQSGNQGNSTQNSTKQQLEKVSLRPHSPASSYSKKNNVIEMEEKEEFTIINFDSQQKSFQQQQQKLQQQQLEQQQQQQQQQKLQQQQQQQQQQNQQQQKSEVIPAEKQYFFAEQINEQDLSPDKMRLTSPIQGMKFTNSIDMESRMNSHNLNININEQRQKLQTQNLGTFTSSNYSNLSAERNQVSNLGKLVQTIPTMSSVQSTTTAVPTPYSSVVGQQNSHNLFATPSDHSNYSQSRELSVGNAQSYQHKSNFPIISNSNHSPNSYINPQGNLNNADFSENTIFKREFSLSPSQSSNFGTTSNSSLIRYSQAQQMQQQQQQQHFKSKAHYQQHLLNEAEASKRMLITSKLRTTPEIPCPDCMSKEFTKQKNQSKIKTENEQSNQIEIKTPSSSCQPVERPHTPSMMITTINADCCTCNGRGILSCEDSKYYNIAQSIVRQKLREGENILKSELVRQQKVEKIIPKEIMDYLHRTCEETTTQQLTPNDHTKITENNDKIVPCTSPHSEPTTSQMVSRLHSHPCHECNSLSAPTQPVYMCLDCKDTCNSSSSHTTEANPAEQIANSEQKNPNSLQITKTTTTMKTQQNCTVIILCESCESSHPSTHRVIQIMKEDTMKAQQFLSSSNGSNYNGNMFMQSQIHVSSSSTTTTTTMTAPGHAFYPPKQQPNRLHSSMNVYPQQSTFNKPKFFGQLSPEANLLVVGTASALSSSQEVSVPIGSLPKPRSYLNNNVQSNNNYQNIEEMEKICFFYRNDQNNNNNNDELGEIRSGRVSSNRNFFNRLDSKNTLGSASIGTAYFASDSLSTGRIDSIMPTQSDSIYPSQFAMQQQQSRLLRLPSIAHDQNVIRELVGTDHIIIESPAATQLNIGNEPPQLKINTNEELNIVNMLLSGGGESTSEIANQLQQPPISDQILPQQSQTAEQTNKEQAVPLQISNETSELKVEDAENKLMINNELLNELNLIIEPYRVQSLLKKEEQQQQQQEEEESKEYSKQASRLLTSSKSICVKNVYIPLNTPLSMSSNISNMSRLSSSISSRSSVLSQSLVLSQPYRAKLIQNYSTQEMLADETVLVFIEILNNGIENWPDKVFLRCIQGITDKTEYPTLKINKDELASLAFSISLKNNPHSQAEGSSDKYETFWRLYYILPENEDEHKFFGPKITIKFTNKPASRPTITNADTPETTQEIQLVIASQLKSIFQKDNEEEIECYVQLNKQAIEEYIDSNKGKRSDVSQLVIRFIEQYVYFRNRNQPPTVEEISMV